PIEPLVSEQWFVKMQPLAEPAIGALKKGDLQFRPERWGKVYLHWLENVQDWCISRQLWWGHRIPVWYDEDDVGVASVDELEIGAPHPKTGKPIVRQDPDVLDTWASSWLFPIATLGWPDKDAADLRRFYPTQFLSTAQEIIYLWVARMVMAGYAFMPELDEPDRNPFSTCYIHATVLDAKGKRMSKSAGNGIDPLDMIEQYGADAVRYSLVLLTKEGQDVRLAPDRFEQGSRFCNKVWNAARFVMMNLAGERATGAPERFEDRWILSRLARTIEEVSAALDEYRFNDAATTMYRFVWNDFCDWYVELSKHRLTGDDEASARDARATLTRVLRDTLGLLHPFTPYITEALWEALHDTLGEEAPAMLAVAPWPTGEGLSIDEAAEAEMRSVQDLVGCVRQVRALTMVAERKPLPVVANVANEGTRGVLQRHADAVRSLAFLESLELTEGAERPASSAVAVAGGIEAYVVLGEEVDFAKLRDVLAGRAEKVGKALVGAEKKLQNEGFLAKAGADVVEAERERVVELQHEKDLLERNVAGF
ncbi:MAG: class I tRNA ligase family protein, partial [Planctomycetota bacterium]